MVSLRSALPLLATTLGLALAACGGDEATSSGDAAGESAGPAPETALGHIHGLGVNPADDALYIATHEGLFRAPSGEAGVERVGDSRQDIMGFSVVGPDRFVGSGHPSISQMREEGLPPLLGLIESRDGGRTWKNVSLLGAADFHVLRSAGDRIYGYDGSQGLLVSSNAGRTWRRHTPPAPLLDLAIDPRDPGRVVASTEDGLFVSNDAGKTFERRRDDIAGLLAWPGSDALYALTSDGRVQRSRDGARDFSPAGDVGGQPVAFVAQAEALYVALADGTVKRSTDGGATWALRAAP